MRGMPMLPETCSKRIALYWCCLLHDGAALQRQAGDMCLEGVGKCPNYMKNIEIRELADGAEACGFICEPRGIAGAKEISAQGGWRAYIAAC